MEAWRLEGALRGVIAEGSWSIKSYFYTSGRGIPGAIINNVWKRSQRQWDRNFFTQGSFQKSISSRHDLLLNAKYANDRMRYLNPDTTLLYIDNTFLQQEIYLSLAHKYRLMNNWDLALATDLQWNGLRTDLEGFVTPMRYSALMALATAVQLDKVKMQGSLLATLVRDLPADHSNPSGASGAPGEQTGKPKYSPALFFSYKPFHQHDLHLRAFYKHIFRMPTFNDLYYADIGRVDLQPEYTRQYNLGLQYGRQYPQGMIRGWELQGDAYFNRVTDKIIAVPKGNGMYRWMMMNRGEVEIKGVDLRISASALPLEVWLLTLKLNYTYQQALDLTRRTNKELEQLTYGGQIAYIPWHSGSLTAGVYHEPWQLNYSFIYVGERYRASANIPENHEQPWYTNDLSLTRTFNLGSFRNKVSLEVNNLFSQDYEVVLNYPMPKRNFKISWMVEI